MSQSLPAPSIETVPIEQLKPWGKNPRRGHAVDAIARSIQELGYLAPIIVQKGTYRILAGHGRLEALRRLGALYIPVVVADLSDDQADLYTIADNRLSELAGWDEEVLAQLVQDLQAKDLDMSIAGFDETSIEQLLREAEDQAQEDEVVEPVAEAIAERFDIWVLGDHRIVCQDSGLEGGWLALMQDGQRADLVFTDPPYGVDYKAKKFDPIKNDELKGDELMAFLRDAFIRMRAWSKEDAAFYIWHASSTREDFAWAMKAAALVERQYLIWVKPAIVLGHADYQWQHEPCFYAAKDGARPAFYGARDQATVWQIGMRQGAKLRYQLGPGVAVSLGDRRVWVSPAPPRGRKIRRIRVGPDQVVDLATDAQGGDCWFVSRDPMAEHPTQKPVELARRAILNSTQPGDLVIDGFLGSGSTLIACELTGRKCRGMELAPQYVDVVVKRWERLTGRKAVRISKGALTP